MDYTAAARTEVCCVTEPWAESRCTEVGACRDLLTRVVDQTERRVFADEKVPASEKVVSLFEPHTDIICKGGRQTHYGRKINLSTDAARWCLTWWWSPATRPTVNGACRC